MFHETCEFTETRAVTQRVTKGRHIEVHLEFQKMGRRLLTIK